MAGYSWSGAEEHLLKALLGKELGNKEIAEQINKRVAAGAIGFRTERSADAVRKKIQREGWTAETGAYTSVDQHWAALKKIADQYNTKDQQLNTRGLVKNAMRKILFFSDIHVPFPNWEMIHEMIEDHKDADVVIVGGDLFDAYAYMTYPKDRSIAVIDEYNCAFNLIEILRKIFPKVIIVGGNHDNRVTKYFRRLGASSSALSIFQTNILKRLANGEVLDRTGMTVEIKDFSNVYYDEVEDHYIKVGKTLFFHPSTYGGKQPGSTVTSFGDKLSRRYRDDEVDSHVCGHTHKVYKGIINGKMYIESGCSSSMLEYFFKPNHNGNRHYQSGYTVIYQDKDGNTDFNKSGPVYKGECLAPKKDALNISGDKK